MTNVCRDPQKTAATPNRSPSLSEKHGPKRLDASSPGDDTKWQIFMPSDPTPMIRTFYLIRHGETVFNAESRIQGQSDAPLSERGRRQAEAVADALADAPIDAIFSSPLRRALETASCLAAKLSLPIRTDPRLMELNAGVFEGRLRSELEAESSPEFLQWLAGGDEFTIPGGESRRQLAQRGGDALRALAAEGYRTTVVVTHGGWLSATLKSLLHLPQPLPPFSLGNGSITRLAVDPQGGFSLLSLNEVDHLRTMSKPNERYGPLHGE